MTGFHGILGAALLASAAAAQGGAPPGGVIVPLPPGLPRSDAEALVGELRGVVAEVRGGEVRITLAERYVPREGDRVDLYGAGRERGVFTGWWSVSYAEGDVVRARPLKQVLAPAPGQQAVLFLSLPCGVAGRAADPRLGAMLTPDPRPGSEIDRLQTRQRQFDLEQRARQAYQRGQRAATAGGWPGAAEAYREAGELNHAEAAWELYRLHAAGRAGAPEAAEAAKWLRRAAELGQTDAQCALGRAFREGRLVAADPEKGLAWLRKAAAGGSREAEAALRTAGR